MQSLLPNAHWIEVLQAIIAVVGFSYGLDSWRQAVLDYRAVNGNGENLVTANLRRRTNGGICLTQAMLSLAGIFSLFMAPPPGGYSAQAVMIRFFILLASTVLLVLTFRGREDRQTLSRMFERRRAQRSRTDDIRTTKDQ